MGSNDFYPEERAVHRVSVDAFWIDEHPVTVAEFRRFVKATGYATVAERPIDPEDYPGADRDLLVSGSLVFHMTPEPEDLNDYRNWWAYVPGANWRHPEGPEARSTDVSATQSRTWRSRTRRPTPHGQAKSSPTEAEWEYAARGGLEGATFAWGDEFAPKGKMMANTWQGEFPWQNLLTDGHERTSPVKSFPPNGYGLFDVAGNVWEWTADHFTPRHTDEVEQPCCGRATLASLSPTRESRPPTPPNASPER